LWSCPGTEGFIVDSELGVSPILNSVLISESSFGSCSFISLQALTPPKKVAAAKANAAILVFKFFLFYLQGTR